jgi:ArsR family transcriptional regulator, arsenate/arsenite/antimonite-responsive transcriptional repressor
MKKTAQLFKALSDETRLRILSLLTAGELCVCELMATLNLPQSTVSRHLAYLRNAGLVEDRRQGVWMFYRLAEDGSTMCQDLMARLPLHLSELPQARQDQVSLQAYLDNKSESSCG